METTSRLYDELKRLLGQSSNWADKRHLYTLVWMLIGLIYAGSVNLTKWSSYIKSRAVFAQSRQRRFSRWLNNPRINVQKIYSPIIKAGLSQWNAALLYLSLDTTMLWNEFCIVRVSVVYRGRAVPVAWKVLTHPSSSVKFDSYKLVLNRVAGILPTGVKIILLADRGFVDIELMHHCQALNWNYRIRVKRNFWVCRPKKQPIQIKQFHCCWGEAILLHNVKVTKTHLYGFVSLALGRESIGGEFWAILSNETTSLQTFREYGLRFDIEENFLDDKSNGFNLERSEIRSSTPLSRLCLVLAIATLYLTSTGTQVVDMGKRRFVDPHWHRGSSYLRIGWEWVKTAITNHWELFSTLLLLGSPDPEPSRACRKQELQKLLLEFKATIYQYSW